MRRTFGITTNPRSRAALGCSCDQGILLKTGGKPRFPALPPCMVNKGNGKGLSRSHTTQSDQTPHTNAFASSLEVIPRRLAQDLGDWQDDHDEKDLKESERASGQDAPVCRCALAHHLLGLQTKHHQRPHHERAHSDGFNLSSHDTCV